MRAEVGFRSCFLLDIGQVVVICTEYVLDRGSPGRALSRSPPGKNKMDSGQIQGRSRGQGSRNSNSSLFLAGKTDRQVTRILYPRDGQSSNLSVARWTDTLSYFQSPVLALAWIERLLTRRGTVLREGRVSQTYFLLPIVIFGIKWAPSGATPLCLGPILGGRKVNVGQPGTSFYLSMLQLCAKNGLDETFINAEKI